MINSIIKKLSFVLMMSFLFSCDKDYNTVGADIIGENNIGFLSGEDHSDMIEEIKNVGYDAVQSSNLPINQLGFLDGYFGSTTASFVTQLSLVEENPILGTQVSVDSVVMSVPYFSTKLSTNELGTGRYRLDSVYSSNKNYYVANADNSFDIGKLNPIKLEVYRNGYTLGDYDVNDLSKTAKYFSNQSLILDKVVGNRLNNVVVDGKYIDDRFVPSNKEYIEPVVDDKLVLLNQDLKNNIKNIKARHAPIMRVRLDSEAFKNDILDKIGSGLLANNNVFKSYYKGLVLKASSVNGSGSLFSLDLRKGNVTIYYKQNVDKSDTKERKSLVLNMTGNSVNLLDNNNSVFYGNSFGAINPSEVCLKGGSGSMLELKLKQQLFDKFKSDKVLVNDASLYFTVKQDFVNAMVAGKSLNYLTPLRLFLYDIESKRAVLDLTLDGTRDNVNAKKGKYIYGGILTKVGEKYMYRIRITDHINQILQDTKGNFVNNKLGLAIIEDVNLFSSTSLSNFVDVNFYSSGKYSPLGSVLSPLGVLLGGKSGDDKILLKISYTKPN